MTPLDRNSDRPAYKQIADRLRSKILNGELPEGSQLPSERDLSAEYDTSRVTVRQAIALLRNEGLVAARRGHGVFVRQRQRIPRRSPSRLSQSARDVNRSAFTGDAILAQYTSSVATKVTTEPADERVAEALGLKAGAEVTVRDRVMSVDGDPVQLATSYYDREITRGTPIEVTDTGPGGVHARLSDLGREPVRFTETLIASMPEPEVAQSLGLEDGTPVISIVRVSYDKQDRAVEITNMSLAANRYELTYEFSS